MILDNVSGNSFVTNQVNSLTTLVVTQFFK